MKSIFKTELIIRKPTIISAGAVAKDGMAKKTGDRNRDRPKKIAATTDVSPVLPPSATPEALSTNVVVVEVPNTAPREVPMASDRRAPLIFGSFPSLSSISALDATPISVPSVSNISTNRNANMMVTKFRDRMPLKSILKKVGAMLWIPKPLEKSGSTLNIPSSAFGWYSPVTSQIIPKIHVMRIPQRMFPFMFLTTRILVISTPIRASSTVIPTELNVPASREPLNENTDTRVALSTTILAFCRPMKAIKSPIPADTACFRFMGMALKIASRTLVRDSAMKIRPSTNTAARAICQV